MSLTLDSSATLAWIYSDETTDAICAVFDRVAELGAIVPALWRLEVANSLTEVVRWSRIDAEFRRAALADLALLDITTSSTPTAKRGPRRCIWPIATASPSMTRPIWNSRGAQSCRLPRWITNSALLRRKLASTRWGQYDGR